MRLSGEQQAVGVASSANDRADLTAQPAVEPENDSGAEMDSAPESGAPEARAALTVSKLARTFESDDGAVKAVAGISFRVEPGEFFTLLGPSGCGKSTTLRCVAGLETPDSGQITIGDRTVYDSESRVSLPVHERAVGMVFQNYAIWPHMTVFDHVAFPLRMIKKPRVPKKEINARVNESLDQVGLGDLGSRIATKLSGGQQQRLALARALVARPRLLLLDEPLSNLDASLRERMRDQLRELQDQTGVTTLYVTHDQSEAFGMSSRIAVMESGSIVQIGTPLGIYSRPASKYVATFVGKTNLLEGEAERGSDAGSVLVAATVGMLHATAERGVDLSGRVGVVVRPEDVEVSEEPIIDRENVFEGSIAQATFLGETVEYQIDIKGALITSRRHPAGVLAPGTTVYVRFPADRCVVIADDAGMSPTDSAAIDDGE